MNEGEITNQGNPVEAQHLGVHCEVQPEIDGALRITLNQSDFVLSQFEANVLVSDVLLALSEARALSLQQFGTADRYGDLQGSSEDVVGADA